MENVNDNYTGLSYTDSYYSIAKLKEIENLSGRAIYTCNRANFDCLMDIIEFLKKGNSFLMMRGCGTKTNDELKRLYEKYINNINLDSIEEQTKIKEHKNLTLDELKRLEYISNETFYVCESEGLNRLREIIEYYRKNRTFLNIKNCGRETNNELKSLCDRYVFFFLNFNSSKKITHKKNEKIIKINNLSARACGVCKRNNLNNLNDIIDYYKKKKSFIHIRNCGSKTNRELIKLCINHQFHIISPDSYKEYTKLNKTLCFETGDLGAIEKLPLRAITVCLNNGLNNLQDIIDYYERNDSFLKLRRCGVLSNYLLEDICLKYIQMNSELFPDNFVSKNFIDEISVEFGINIKDYISDFSVRYENKNLQLLKIIELILFNSNYFNKIDKEIIKSIYMEDGITLQEIAVANSLTRERIRERAHKISRRFSYLQGIIGRPINMFWDFVNKENIELKDDIFIVDASVVEKINNENGTNFRIDFIGHFLAKCNLDYSLMNNNKYQKDIYLLRKTYETNEILNFIDYIQSVIYTKRYEDKLIRWEDFLLIKEERDRVHNKFKYYQNIFKIIAMNEFGLQIENETILIKRNTPKTKTEYIIEILNKFDRPMHVSEMFAEINEKEPGMFKDKDAIRWACQKKIEIINFSRTSTYGLKKWEKEKENLKGGSIRKMVEEYLRNENTPKHIDNITEYVNKYRNTNSKSVLTSLKSMKTNTFKFHEGRYVGLSDENKI